MAPRTVVFVFALALSCKTRETFPGPPLGFGPVASASTNDVPITTPPGDGAAPTLSTSAHTFYKAQSAADWIAHSFDVQSKYTRVLAVYSGDRPPTKVSVPRLDFESPQSAHVDELAVTQSFKTLDEAASAAKGGDLVAVLPGRYKGFRIDEKSDAADGRYIHFRALGAPGDVIIDGPSASSGPNWMILLHAAHHVIVQGFNLAGTAHGARAGILIDGAFVETSKLAHHIAIIGNFSHDHKSWGIHSVDSQTVLVENNLFANSAQEHSAYFSDGSDDYVIRRNVFANSNASGLQVNLDPEASLDKLAEHPKIHYSPKQTTRDWALGLLKQATEVFGANAFPDGRGYNFRIEENVIYGNGKIGGAAINLAGMRESIIQNNLVYANLSAGIAEWDNGNPFDAASRAPGPQSPGDVTSADALPIFGCSDNTIRNNTIVTSTRGRAALIVGNGSWGTRAFNNVLVNDAFPSIELLNTSIWRFEASNDVVGAVSYEGAASALKSLAIALPDGPTSTVGVNRKAVDDQLVRPSNEPWVVLDGSWWKLNPARPDFHPRGGSTLLAGKGDARNLPPTDLEGKKWSKPDIGAFAATP